MNLEGARKGGIWDRWWFVGGCVDVCVWLVGGSGAQRDEKLRGERDALSSLPGERG
jgi:hypothetical protein